MVLYTPLIDLTIGFSCCLFIFSKIQNRTIDKPKNMWYNKNSQQTLAVLVALRLHFFISFLPIVKEII